MPKVRHLELEVSENDTRGRDLLMRQLQEILQKPQLVEHFQRGWMYGIAAEVPIEIAVLLDHGNVHAFASEQITEHHARWSAADNATRRIYVLIRHGCFSWFP